jgi:site-specific recombinase XerD
MKKLLSAEVQQLRQEMEYRNYSEKTVNTYCSLMSTMEFDLSKTLHFISVDELKSYLHHALIEKKLSSTYINQNISAYKIFVQDVLKQDWNNIRIKRPRREKKFPVVLSVKEVERLIAVTTNLKHRVMLMLMYSAGLRKMELKQMKPSAIDSERMLVHISQGKGKKDRYSILSAKTLEHLRLYYKLVRPKIFLFEPQGKKGNMVSDGTIDHIVKKSAEYAGIKKHISAHTLRHSFATHLLEKGVNIKLIQNFLGHTSIRTTTVYLHLTNFNPSSVTSPLEEMDI